MKRSVLFLLLTVLYLSQGYSQIGVFQKVTADTVFSKDYRFRSLPNYSIYNGLTAITTSGYDLTTPPGTTAQRPTVPANKYILRYNTDSLALEIGNPAQVWKTLSQSSVQTFDTSSISNFGLKVRSQFSASAPLLYNGVTGNLSIPVATGVVSGYLSQADWVVFNTKLPDPGSNGLVARTALGITAARQLVASSSNVSIVNPTGVSGNPAIDLNDTLILQQLMITRVPAVASDADSALFLNRTTNLLEVRPVAAGGGGSGTFNKAGGGISFTGDSLFLNQAFTRGLFSGVSPISYNSSTGSFSLTVIPISLGGTNSSTALSNNRVMQSSGGAIVEASAITAARALISDANGIPTHSTVTATELAFSSGVTSSIQTQLNTKISNISGLLTAGTDINITGSGTSGSPFNVNSTTTSNNGLTKTGSNTQLGGTLVQATTISNAGFDFLISGTGSNVLRTTNGTFQSMVASSPSTANLTASNSSTNLFSEINALEGSATVVGGNNTTYYNQISANTTNIELATRSNTTPHKLILDNAGQITLDAYPGSFETVDTSFHALVTNGSGKIFHRAGTNGAGGGGGSSQNLRLDLPVLSETKIYSPAQGIASSSNVTNYSHTSIDSAKYRFSTTRAGTGGSEYGGWLFSGTSGDSVRVTAPFWVVFGDSQAEGHPGRHGRLHPGSATFDPNYGDLAGQLSYHLRYLTNMRWYNHGIGGQTTVDCVTRFFRDVLGVNSPNSNDGRGNQTLSRKPEGVVIILGINDIFNGIPPQKTRENLKWMASICQQYGIRCVFLNIPGDATASQANLQGIASMNTWLASGVMDQYGACVVDYNSWWNDPAYSGDNIHPTSLIADDIHPTMAGYDSLATYIYQRAKLPKLTKMIFTNELDPGGFTGYSRPAGITINSVPYTISSANDTINITSYVPDSVWVKVTSSTNITGTTYSGFEHIQSYTTNNPLDSQYYTKRTLYSGSQVANITASDITLTSPTLLNGHDIIKTYLGDGANVGLTVRHYAASARLILNTETILSGAALSINGGGVSLGTDGNIISAGTRSQFNQLEINQNSAADNSGFGISAANTTSSISIMGSGQAGKDLVRITTWNTNGVANLGTNPTNIMAIRSGFGSTTDINQVGNALSIDYIINNTVGDAGGVMRGIKVRPEIVSATNTKIEGIYQKFGDNYLSVNSTDKTCIGCDSNATVGAKLHAIGSVRLDLSSDANYDVFYRGSDNLLHRLAAGTDGYVFTTHSTSSAPTWEATSAGAYTFTNGLTETSGTVKLGGALTASTTITGNQILNLGTTGGGSNPLTSMNIVTNGRLAIFSGITYDVDADNTDANYTVAANTIVAEISDVLTTNRTLTLPTAAINGQSITILTRYSIGLNKYSLSAAVTDNTTGLTFTQLDWGKTYDFMVDQGLQWRLIRKY